MYREVARKNPNYADAWSGIGDCLAALDRKDEAVSAYERAVAIQETHYNQYQAGQYLRQMGRSSEAVPHLQRAVALNPHYPLYSGDLGEALY